MKTKVLTLLFIFSLNFSFSQGIKENYTRYIQVTGSAEMEIDPDEIRFKIGIEEYWKEEFEKGKEYKDYITKVPIEDIEKSLIPELISVGISKEQIIINEVGNYWRSNGKDFKKSKTIEIIITDFKKIDEIILNVKTRGINYMRIAELKNKNITEYRKQLKIEAMKAAKYKATYLLESIGDSLGQTISVVEVSNNIISYWNQRDMYSNTILSSSSNNNSDNENMKKIKLKYEVSISFEIK